MYGTVFTHEMLNDVNDNRLKYINDDHKMHQITGKKNTTSKPLFIYDVLHINVVLLNYTAIILKGFILTSTTPAYWSPGQRNSRKFTSGAHRFRSGPQNA